MSSTASQHIGTAVDQNFQLLFGSNVKETVLSLAKTHGCVNFVCVGDAASANLKFAAHFFAYLRELGEKSNVTLTTLFTHCGLHQMSRILGLFLERQSLKSALYSVTRLHQHSSIREKTRECMRLLLIQRFVYKENECPPAGRFTSTDFRKLLLHLLTGTWDGESDDDHLKSARQEAVEELLKFFNGNIMDDQAWTHYCNGCHQNRHEALQHVLWPCSVVRSFPFV
eukprot:Skav223980  [mRNA]  locus=scaffold1107:333114:333791:- [translate_table: standard]